VRERVVEDVKEDISVGT
jgi:hypothetical protein